MGASPPGGRVRLPALSHARAIPSANAPHRSVNSIGITNLINWTDFILGTILVLIGSRMRRRKETRGPSMPPSRRSLALPIRIRKSRLVLGSVIWAVGGLHLLGVLS
jgi:hypothetical protein